MCSVPWPTPAGRPWLEKMFIRQLSAYLQARLLGARPDAIDADASLKICGRCSCRKGVLGCVPGRVPCLGVVRVCTRV